MAQRNNTAKFELVDGLTNIKLRDERGKKYSIAEESRWMHLLVEKSNSDNDVGLCRLYAFVDTYQGTSQVDECRRPEISKHYFGGKVGEKVSIDQLQGMRIRDIYDIVKTVRQKGVRTRSEYEETGGVEGELIGKTRHTVLNHVSFQPHEMDRFEQTLRKKPLYVSFEGNETLMQIIGEENNLFRRYETDENSELGLGWHAVLGIGYGYCINDDDDKDDIVPYVIGQNNWPTGTTEICRFSYKSFRYAVGFDF